MTAVKEARLRGFRPLPFPKRGGSASRVERRLLSPAKGVDVKMTYCAVLLLLVSAAVHEVPARKPVIEILPDLKSQANAETPDNGIPWFSTKAAVDVQIKGTFSSESALVKTVKEGWSYTVYRLTYAVAEVQKGDFAATELTFFVERPFPTPESGIRLKELWPFRKEKPLIFKLAKAGDRYLITSIEQ